MIAAYTGCIGTCTNRYRPATYALQAAYALRLPPIAIGEILALECHPAFEMAMTCRQAPLATPINIPFINGFGMIKYPGKSI